MRFTTETGSTYLWAGGYLTRLPAEGNGLRRDGEPVRVLDAGAIVVGQPAVFTLQLREDGRQTVRVTSPVAAIDGEPGAVLPKLGSVLGSTEGGSTGYRET